MEQQTTVPETSPFATLAGLFLALGAPVLVTLALGRGVLGTDPDDPSTILLGLASMWLLTAALLIFVRRAEQRPLASIGWIRPSPALVLQAIGLGILLSLAVPVLSVVAGRIIPAGPDGSIESAARIPWWLMLLSVSTAGVTEEVLFRGYALERLLELTGSKWVSSIIAIAFFTLIHVGGWNLAHIIGVVIPLGVALTLLYWWRRSLALVAIVHFTINLPLVFMALGDP